MNNFFFLVFFSIFSTNVFAQKTLRFVEKNYWLRTSENQINLGLYNQTENSLSNFFEKRTIDTSDFETQYGQYLQLLCQLKLSKLNAENEFKKFINHSSYDLVKEKGNFELGKYYFAKNNFEFAIPAFEKTTINFLSNEEITERNFQLGYAYLATKKLDKVEPLFSSIKGIVGQYYTPGNYYHGLFSYYNKNYDEAINSFKAIEKDTRYESIVPFYLTEINYLKGDKDLALSEAKKQIAGKQKLVYQNELNQLVGQIYFEKENYEQAEKYFNTYITSCESPRSEDYFRLSYAQYQQAKFENAIANFTKISNENSNYYQLSNYYLALSNLHINKKDEAYNAMLICSQLNTDSQLKEIAMFTIAKLSYENKDDELAKNQFATFISTYPQSKYYSEAIELLAYLDIKTDRFDDAMIAMNKMNMISDPLKKMYQQANYSRGIQMLVDSNPERALSYFDETNRYKMDENVSILTPFWQAESMYRIGKYNESLEFADYFLNKANQTSTYQDYIQKIHILKSYVYFHNDDKEKLKTEFVFINPNNNSTPESVLGIAKSNFIPAEIPLVNNAPSIFVYNLPEDKLAISYNPIPLKPLSFDLSNTKKKYLSYIKGGLGNLSTYNFEFGYDLSSKVLFPLYIDYRSTSSSKEIIKFQRYSESHIGLKTEKKIKDYLVSGQIAFDRNKQYYYGYDHVKYDYSNSDIKQVFSNFGINLDAKKLSLIKNDISFHPKGYIGIYLDKFKASESKLLLDLPFEKIIDEHTKVTLGALFDLNVYHVGNIKNQNNSLIEIKPSIEKRVNNALIKIGLYPTLAQKFYLLPNVSIQYPLQKNNATILGGLESKIQLNTFKEITQINPFIFNYFDVHQSRINNLFIGLNGCYHKNLSISTKIGLGQQTNLPLFINDTATDNKQFHVVYDKKATFFLLNTSLNFTFNENLLAGIDLSLKPITNLSSEKRAWGYRANTLDIYAKFKATREISIKSSIFIRSGSIYIEKNHLVNSVYSSSLPGAIDINLSANYKASPTLSIYLDFNNLFNNKYQRWIGYQNFGTNIQFGFTKLFK